MATRRQQDRRRTRWLAWLLGLAALGAGLWALSAPDPAGPPLDDIDPESRARLEQVIRDEVDDGR